MGMSALEYRSMLQALLPEGAAWPRDADTVLADTLLAIADELARVDKRVDDFLDESDPRTTFELLPDWERVLGLPAPCVPAGQTTTERRNALAQKVAALGGQSLNYFFATLQTLGYVGANWTRLGWHFISAAQGWAASNASVTLGTSSIIVTASAADPQLRRTGLAFDGSQYRYVTARLKRNSAPDNWDGTVFYQTAAHGESASFVKTIAEPAGLGAGYVLAVWDMHALTSGGADWKTNFITGVRLDLGTSNGDVYEIDWIAISKTTPVDMTITIDEQVDGLPHRWRINAPTNTITEATCESPCNDPLREWGNELLECVMNRYKPAQSELLFGYS